MWVCKDGSYFGLFRKNASLIRNLFGLFSFRTFFRISSFFSPFENGNFRGSLRFPRAALTFCTGPHERHTSAYRNPQNRQSRWRVQPLGSPLAVDPQPPQSPPLPPTPLSRALLPAFSKGQHALPSLPTLEVWILPSWGSGILAALCEHKCSESQHGSTPTTATPSLVRRTVKQTARLQIAGQTPRARCPRGCSPLGRTKTAKTAYSSLLSPPSLGYWGVKEMRPRANGKTKHTNETKTTREGQQRCGGKPPLARAPRSSDL